MSWQTEEKHGHLGQDNPSPGQISNTGPAEFQAPHRDVWQSMSIPGDFDTTSQK